MSDNKWLVVMQRSNKEINNGLRLSQIFGHKAEAERYAEQKSEMDKYDNVHVVMRSEV